MLPVAGRATAAFARTPLDELPTHESFHNLDMVFEVLATLNRKRKFLRTF